MKAIRIKSSVGIVTTGTSNTASLEAALYRLGVKAERVEDPAKTSSFDFLILPGVGAFGPVASKLRQNGMMDVLKDRIKADRPTLAICLGMQLLFSSSSESPGARGIGAIDSDIEPLFVDSTGKLKAHFGWAKIGNPSLESYAYFAHSYAAKNAPSEWQPEFADANIKFVASIRRGAVMGCQYHPEISGHLGQRILSDWIKGKPNKKGASQ